jgi:hypothetical protein
MRNVRWPSAARAVPVRAGTGESPSTTASSISSMEIDPLRAPDPVPGASLSTGSAGTAPYRTGALRRPAVPAAPPSPPRCLYGPVAEQTLPHGDDVKSEAAASGTFNTEAAPWFRWTW